MAKRTPDHLKIVAGTAEKRRMNPAAPAPEVGTAPAPIWLSASAAETYDRVASILTGLGLAATCDQDMMALLASRLVEVEELTAVIEDQGRTYRTDSGLWRSRPEVGMRNEAVRHAQSLLAEFGLSPATRAKVSAVGPVGKNPFSCLDEAT